MEWTLQGIQRLFQHQIPPQQVAAFLVEPVQGEGGYVVPPVEFLPALRKICDEYGILLIVDEVQTGFGRTGEMFASQLVGVTPDIMSIAKGIASGFPLGATVASHELMSKWLAGAHGTTFGGNPIACAAALATLDVIREENLLENCRQMGKRFMTGLLNIQKKYPQIGDVRRGGAHVSPRICPPQFE